MNAFITRVPAGLDVRDGRRGGGGKGRGRGDQGGGRGAATVTVMSTVAMALMEDPTMEIMAATPVITVIVAMATMEIMETTAMEVKSSQ